MPDPRAELMRQIQRALVLEGGLQLEQPDGRGGFDPYNSRATVSAERWQTRRRG